MTVDPITRAFRRLSLRHLTNAGNRVAVTVTSGATSLAVTWPVAEPDTTYGVHATPRWLTTVAVTARTTAGCTVAFGTAPGADSAVDLTTFRSE